MELVVVMILLVTVPIYVEEVLQIILTSVTQTVEVVVTIHVMTILPVLEIILVEHHLIVKIHQLVANLDLIAMSVVEQAPLVLVHLIKVDVLDIFHA